MATAECTINYRPVRAGFLVREQSLEDLRKAAGIATMMWGGVYNPIIPVGVDSQKAKQLCDMYNVDVLIPMHDSTEIKQLMTTNIFLGLPQFPHQTMFTEEWQTKKLDLMYLDIVHAIELEWTRGIKDMEKGKNSNASFVTWQASDPLATLFSLRYGHYPVLLDPVRLFSPAFENGLRAKPRPISPDDVIPKNLCREVSPIQFTGHELRMNRPFDIADGVYIGHPDSFDDLVAFWNIRATGPHLEFVAINTPRVDDTVAKHVHAITKHWHANDMKRGGLAVHYRIENDAAKDEFFDKHPDTAPKIISPIYPGEYGAVERSFAAHFDSQRVLASIDHKFGRPSVTMALPERKFLTPRSEDFLKTHWQHLAVSVSVLTEFDYPGHTLHVPYLRPLNEFYSRQMAVDPWQLRVEKESIASIDRANDPSLTLYPIPRKSIVEELFRTGGIGTEYGVPGKLTSRIIASMKDHEALDGCRVFKIRGVRSLLKSMAADETVTYTQALQAIGSQQFDKFKGLYIARRDTRELTPEDVLFFLLEKRILRPVLAPSVDPEALVQHRCTACGLATPIPILTFVGDWKCPVCEQEHAMPTAIRETFSLGYTMAKWCFMKSGLFSRDNNQEGAIPVILSLMFFGNMFHFDDCFCWTTPMELKFDVPGVEIDMSVMQYKYGPDIELGIGEAKSDGGTITEQKIAGMLAARKKLQRPGLHVYLIFAKTVDAFQESEIALFRKLRDEHIPVIVLGNYELESYDLAPGDRLPVPITHPFTFSDLERNSEALYLQVK